MPKSRLDFWEPKLTANAERDHRHTEMLEAAGWRIVTIWECETRDAPTLAAKVSYVARLTQE